MMSTNDCYSPDTGEHIHTDNPAEWMGRSGTPAPAYDRSKEGCFWRDGAWVVVASTAQAEAAAEGKEAALAQARMIRETILNRLTGIQLNTDSPVAVVAIKQARADMLNITGIAGVVSAVNADEAKAAITAEWKRIAVTLAVSAPAAVGVFKGFDL